MSQDKERVAFEAWYSQNAFNFERDPIGSRECGLQWKAWQARAALQSSIRRLVAENEALKAEVLEQCRINGMGAEREAKLMTENEDLRQDVKRFREAASCERDLRQEQDRHAAAPEAPAQASAVDERDRKDAERYRFIRNADRSDPHLPFQSLLAYACESLDEAIDDAMEEEARAALAQKGGAA